MSNEKEIMEQHKHMLYPTVRVRTTSAGGSGTLIYSKQDPEKDEGIYESYVLTNEHVIDDNIKVEKKWSTLLKREVKTDILAECSVEMFDFEYGSWEAGHQAYRSEIMCYDKDMDIGLLKIKSEKKFENVARMFPKGEYKKELKMFQPVYAIGCGLGHPPLQTKGQLAGFTDIIDNYPYWLSTAPTIFGNSGGSVYRGDTYEFIGIPSRIAVIAAGFSADAITHMSYFIPISTIYNFLEDQLFNFIFNPSITSNECAGQRRQKRDRDEKLMAVDVEKDATSNTTPSAG
tara:strand:+ start:11077 stop:11940 length:864 start_codon:yes stop_codon:yes gene_type:complete